MATLRELIEGHGIAPEGPREYQMIPAGTLLKAEVVQAELREWQDGTPAIRVAFGVIDGQYAGRKVSASNLDWAFVTPRKTKKGDREWSTIGQVWYNYKAITGEDLPDGELADVAAAVADSIMGKGAYIVVQHEKDSRDASKTWERAKVIDASDPNYAKKLEAAGFAEAAPKPVAPKAKAKTVVRR